jgi:hypothetical protein
VSRRVIIVALSVVVMGLLLWQHQREKAVATCVASGGLWNGPRSTCEPIRVRPILQRELQRSQMPPG